MTLQDQVLRHVRESGAKKSGAWGVHDLDREASGVVVFAKSPSAAESVRASFAAKKADAIYLAVVEGEFETPRTDQGRIGVDGGTDRTEESAGAVEHPTGVAPITGTVRSFLRRLGARVESTPPDEFSGDRAGAKRVEAPRLAITHYRVVARGHGRSLVRVRVKSPRMHQARVHMRDLGHPVSGDRIYGVDRPAPRTMLHLGEISFPHPGTKAPFRVAVPAPAQFWTGVGAEPPAEAPAAGAADRRAPRAGVQDDLGWDHVAGWYDDLVSKSRSDLLDEVITPGVLRLLDPRRGERVVDVACGPGTLCGRLAAMGVEALGIDAAPRMIEFARAHHGTGPGSPRYEVADARRLVEAVGAMDATGEGHSPAGFDGATCIMALMNMDPIGEVARGIHGLLRPGGRVVVVVLHPAFRSPGLTSWGWSERGAGATGRSGTIRRQYRRVDAYLGEISREVVMNPGAVSRGEPAVSTTTHHRPLAAYFNALGEAGLLVDRVEEWASSRRSQPGPHAAEEDRARREFPMFLAIRAVRPVSLTPE